MARDPIETVMKVGALAAISFVGAKVAAPDDGSAPLGAAARKIGAELLKVLRVGPSAAAGALNTIGGSTPSAGVLPRASSTSTAALAHGVAPMNAENYVAAYGSGFTLVIGGQRVPDPTTGSEIWAASRQHDAELEYNRRRAF